MTRSVHDTIRYPHVTEKSTLKKEEQEGRVVTFQVDIASHVERPKHMLEYIGQAVMKHGCRRPAANI